MKATIFTATIASAMLIAGVAVAQQSGTTGDGGAGAVGGATGATSGPGSVNDASGATGGTGGPTDPNATGSTDQGTSAPSNNCDPAKAGQAGNPTNQNMATGGCMK